MKRIVVRSIIALTANLTLISSAIADAPATPQNVLGAWIMEYGAPLYARVSWDLSGGATGYNVFRYNSTNEQWDLIAPAVTGNFFRDLAVSEFPAYYTVSAVGPDGESAGSPSVTAEAGDAGGYEVMRPEMYPGRLTPTNAFIVWISAWITGSDGMLEFGDSPTNLSLVLFDTFYAGGHGLHVSNLEPATVYYYRITAVGTNRAGLAEVFSFETPNTNRPPVAADVTVGQNSMDWRDILLSCTDPDHPQENPFTFRVVTVPTNGTWYASTMTSWDPYVLIYYAPNPGVRGEDHFQYVANDGKLDSAPATVTITNIFMNRNPVVTSIVTNTPEDTALSLVLTATDPDGDPVSIGASGASHGTVSFDGTNLVYTPYPDYNGEDFIYISAVDPYSGYGSGTIEIFVTPVDDAPVAYPVEFATYEDLPLDVSLYLYGSDPEGDSLTYRVVSGPAHGTVTGTYPDQVYTPAENYSGLDSFEFVADDGHLTSAPVTATITVWGINDAPVPTPFSVTLPEDTSTNIVLSGTDVEGDPLTFHVVDWPAHGTLSGDCPELVYTPDANYFGDDSFTYGAFDGSTFSEQAAAVAITITPVSDPPVATPKSVTLPEDTSTNIVLSGTDVDGDALGFMIVTIPAHGTLNGSGGSGANLVYTPAANYHGPDSFTFRAFDGHVFSATATVTITVTSVNDAPVATPKSATLAEDTSTTIFFSGSDVDGDALTFTVAISPAHGTLSGSGASRTYTPFANYHGPDSFTYKAFDGQLFSVPATVSLTVTSVNDAPVATPASVTLAEDTSTNLVLTGTDVDGDALTFTIVTGPTHGTLSGTAPNLVYTPATNYFGGDSFTFTVGDGQTSSAPATVTITVTSVDDAPVATPASVTLAEDSSANIVLSGTDVEGDALTFTVTVNPAHGTLSGTGPDLTYTPSPDYFGSDSFAFVANDGQSNSAPAVVTITVTPVNDAPVATSASVTLAEDTGTNIVLTGTDVEGDGLSFTVISGPMHGTLSGTAPDLTYTPEANYFGGDSFTFAVNDGQLTSASATVTITVTPVNDAPVATPMSVTLAEDMSTNIVLTGTDVEGEALTFTVTVNPAHGTLSGTAPNLTYRPAANYFGNDSFAFKVNDGQADSTAATVALTVTPVNDAPVATPVSATLAEDTSANIVLTGTDVEGDALTFTVASNPAHGTLSGAAPDLVYTPAANYFGSDSFTFTASDGQATSGPATVAITVTPVNDAPAAQAQSASTPYNTALAITLSGTDVEGSALSYVVLTQTASGTLSGTAPNLTFTPIGFSGATSFTFKVNDGSLDSASATVTIIVQAPTSIPAAPNALTATAVSPSQINLVWTDNSNNEDGFKIERSGNGSGWTQIATVGPNVRTYSSTGLVATKSYSYRVRAYNMLGNSAYSNTASAKTPAH
jgi:VCBS repeat-containing protein